MLVIDQLNRKLQLEQRPKRIVSLVPSQTELLIDLGLEEQLVGITKFCVHPSELRKKIASVGGTKQVHFDKIRNLAPDIVICNKEENTKEMVDTISQFAPVWVSDIYNLEDSLAMILALGKIFNVAEKAQAIANQIREEQKSFEVFMANRNIKRVAYIIWKNPYMAAGKQTFINSLLQLNKFQNIVDVPASRYPEMTLDELKKADLVLLSSEPFPFKDKDVFELKNALQKEVRLVDGEYFSWYGSRLQKAFAYFRGLHV